MTSPVTIAIVGIFTIILAVVIIAFILAVRQGNERPRGYRPRREGQRRNDDSPGYIPYGDSPELRSRRRESAVVIGIIVLFIIISLLASFSF